MVDGLPDLGVVTPLGYGNAPGTLRDFAAAAERRGVNGIQVGELASTEVFSLVSAMAAVTSRIRLDTAVIATLTPLAGPSRHGRRDAVRTVVGSFRARPRGWQPYCGGVAWA